MKKVTKNYSLDQISQLELDIHNWDIIFLYGDLWAGKTTLAQSILKNYFWVTDTITSPTYTYYNKYNWVYHFDLYRLENYDWFFAIGWEDVLDSWSTCLIEWPQILEWTYEPDIIIKLTKTNEESMREITIEYKK